MPTTQRVKVKEKYGLVYSAFFPITAEPADARPTYGEEIDLGAAVKAYLTITYATAQAYGDDRAQLDLKEFVSGQLDAETLLSDLEIESKLFGSTYTEGELVDSIQDDPASGAYAYIQKLAQRGSGGTVYRAVFLHHCTPSLNADNADTRNSAITFMNNAVSYAVLADNTGEWRTRKDFEDEASAKAYITSLATGAGT